MQTCLLCWTVTSVCVDVGVSGYVCRVLGVLVGVWGVVMCTGEEVCVVGKTEWDISIGVCFLLYRIFILYLSKELF